MTAYDSLATEYDAGRIGYANDVYDNIVKYGLKPTDEIIDVGSGTGLAAAPFIENGYRVTGVDESPSMLEIAKARYPDASWMRGSAEKLPFDDRSFDAAISAQAFHHFNRAAAMKELVRVVRPGGIVAIWWKHLMADDQAKKIRDEVARELGFEPPHSGLTGGFKEFYGTRFADHALRVLPWRTTIGLAQFMAYERSRHDIRSVYGAHVERYFERVESRLRERFAGENPLVPLDFTQYVYLAKTG